MEKKTDQFDANSMQQAMKLAQSDAGKQLFALLQNQSGGNLQSAMDYAAAGDYQKAMLLMRGMLDRPEVKAILDKMREGSHG